MEKKQKKYYENNKDNLRQEAGNKHRDLSNEERDIKREYGRSWYRNFQEGEKQNLKEYQKNYQNLKKRYYFYFLYAIKDG